METKVLLPTEDNIKLAAEYIRVGELCGMPTETVYGLAANAFDQVAVEKTFEAKGRPQDNPLIVHISEISEISDVAVDIPQLSYRLAKAFWPGPLTMILKKSPKIPMCVTAGMDTVAVRMPKHKVARDFIKACGVPITAPSANLSGKPSPTSADVVYDDLNGKIPVILDGGVCEYGVESTVVLINDNNHLTLLRPGAITVDMLKTVAANVTVDRGVLSEIKDNERALSPGMKHKHYSPNTHVVILDCDFNSFKAYVESRTNERAGAMVFDGEEELLSVPCVTFGAKDDPYAQAKLLFHSLRTLDTLNVDTVYSRNPDSEGIGLAIYNRLLRAAGFEVIKL